VAPAGYRKRVTSHLVPGGSEAECASGGAANARALGDDVPRYGAGGHRAGVTDVGLPAAPLGPASASTVDPIGVAA